MLHCSWQQRSWLQHIWEAALFTHEHFDLLNSRYEASALKHIIYINYIVTLHRHHIQRLRGAPDVWPLSSQNCCRVQEASTAGVTFKLPGRDTVQIDSEGVAAAHSTGDDGHVNVDGEGVTGFTCLLYTSPSPRD